MTRPDANGLYAPYAHSSSIAELFAPLMSTIGQLLVLSTPTSPSATKPDCPRPRSPPVAPGAGCRIGETPSARGRLSLAPTRRCGPPAVSGGVAGGHDTAQIKDFTIDSTSPSKLRPVTFARLRPCRPKLETSFSRSPAYTGQRHVSNFPRDQVRGRTVRSRTATDRTRETGVSARSGPSTQKHCHRWAAPSSWRQSAVVRLTAHPLSNSPIKRADATPPAPGHQCSSVTGSAGPESFCVVQLRGAVGVGSGGCGSLRR